MEFTQLLSLAHRNVHKQSQNCGKVKATPPSQGAPTVTSRNELVRKEVASNKVSKYAVQNVLQEQEQALQDKERKRIEDRRKVADQRLAKLKSIKQKAREEKMASTFEALKQEELKQRQKSGSGTMPSHNQLPKNNIKSQYNCNAAPTPAVAPKAPAAPMDYASLKKMAEKNVSCASKSNDIIVPPHVRLKKDKAKKLEEELVHFKQPKPLKTPKPHITPLSTAASANMQNAQEELKQRQKSGSGTMPSHNQLPKNNIKSQYNCNAAPTPAVAPKAPAAPMDYASLKKMAEKNVSCASKSNDIIVPPHVRLKKDKAKKLEEELVHFKQPKPLKTPKPHITPLSTAASANMQNAVRKPSQTAALHGKGILAQLGVGSGSQAESCLHSNKTAIIGSSVSSSNSKTKSSTAAAEKDKISSHGADRGPVAKRGILAQLGAGSTSSGYQTSSSSSSAKSEDSSHNAKKTTTSAARDAGQSRKRCYDDMGDRRTGSVSHSHSSSMGHRPVPPTHTRPAAARGIAAQLGISASAKHRFQQERERQYLKEEEEDYDSELDDFIDDGEEDYYQQEQEAFAEMRRITGYDPTRYRDDDISDFELRRSMTASVSDILKEEKRSERIGRKEDAIEFRKEQERAKKKLEAKKIK